MTSEINSMSFEVTRPSIDRITSLERKIIGYNTRTVSEPIYENELVKNMAIKICYQANNTNSNSINIPINVCFEGYNKCEL